MMDSPHDHQAEDDTIDAPPMPTQAELEALFDADDADVEAGLVVPAEPVLTELRATAARIRRERAARETTAPRRA